MSAEESTLGPEVRQWLDSRRPPAITAHMRGAPPGPPPIARWEALLRAEQSVVHRLVGAVAGGDVLRRPLRVPARFGERPAPSLEAREKRVREVARTGLARRFGRLLRRPPP